MREEYEFPNIECPHCHGQLSGEEAPSRCPHCGTHLGDVTWPPREKVEKESTSAEEQDTVAGSTLGGAIMGASLIGPAGALLGGLAGWALGEQVNESRRKQESEDTEKGAGGAEDAR